MYYVFIYENGNYSQYSVAFKTEGEALKFKDDLSGYAKMNGVSFWVFKLIG